MKKRYILVLVTLVVLILAGGTYLKLKDDSQPEITQPEQEQTNTVTTSDGRKLTRISATGDIIGHDSLNANAKKETGDYDYFSLMSQIKPTIESGDIRFCNQSTLIGGVGFPITGYPSFNAPEELAQGMVELGCNLVNTASNHSSDKTQTVIDSNVDIWSSIDGPLAVVGQNKSQEQQDSVKIFEVDGLKYAFLAYTSYSNATPPHSYSVNFYSRELASSQIASAKKAGARFLIVSMRWGNEFSENINVFQDSESQYLADLGVSLVLGHGPHVLEPVKKITGTSGNTTVVWYSLGNFLNTQLEPEALFSAVAYIDVDPESGEVVNLSYLPIYMHYEWTPEEAEREDLLKRTNLQLVPLESAVELFKKSQLKTTIGAQDNRIKQTLNKFTPVNRISLSDLGL